jgi:hypothetical protein
VKRIILATVLALASATAFAQTKVSALTAASALDGTELVYCVQGSLDRKCTAAQFKTWASASPTLVTPALGTPASGNFSTGSFTWPTFNQSTTGSAATLTTARAIYGNNFDGTASLTQVIASTFGGTGNGFTKFTGPTTTERTFTLPDADATILYSGGAGGTPSSITLTNASGTAASLTAGTVTTNANLTGDVTSSGNATTLATVNSNVGSFTNSSITVNGKGLITAASSGAAGAILGANTFTALQTITQASANAGILASTGYSLTGSDATGMVNLAGTLNTTGNPIALNIALTNTASGATTKFASFKAGAAGATEVFSVDKEGVLYLNSPSVSGLGTIGATSYLQFQIGGVNKMDLRGTTTSLSLTSDYRLVWSNSTTNPVSTQDLFVGRGAAATLRLGAATGSGAAVAQTFTVQGSTGNSAAAALFTIAGSDQSGTTTTGGGVKIRGGNGTSAGGAVEIWTSATTTPAVAASFAADKTATFAGSFVLTTSATPLAADACTAGRIVWGADYIYVCTASGAWKRAALTGSY